MKLDYENSQLTFPIDAYRISSADFSRILLAREVIMTACMKKYGFTDNPEDAYPASEHRNFGLWNVERAKRNGFDLERRAGAAQTHDEQGPWGEARYKCLDSEKAGLEKVTPPDRLVQGGPAADVAQRSLNLAAQTDSWLQTRELWKSCLSAAGLVAGDGPSQWSTQQAVDLAMRQAKSVPDPADVAEGIRLATVEAECNQKTQLTQTLGDLQASYQVPLIAQNEAVLVRVKEEGTVYVEAADQILRERQ